jgi:ankyrin repeat protein
MDELITAIHEADLQSIKDQIINWPQLLTSTDRSGFTPLMYAVSHYDRNVEVIKLLLDYGADVNASTSDGYTVLHCAVDVNFQANENTSEVIHMLVEAGAALEQRQHYGWTPLMKAVVMGTVEEVRVLLSLGADPNKMMPMDTLPEFNAGRTTLMAALVQPDAELIIGCLLQAGADLFATDLHGMTFFEYASQVMAEIEPGELFTSVKQCVDCAQNFLQQTQP